MNSKAQELYNSYQETTQKAADFNHAAALLEWDAETYMPPKSAAIRGRQLATLAEQAHILLTSPAYGQLLDELNGHADLTDLQQNNVSLSQEDFDKNCKLPASFVAKLTQATSQAHQYWLQARKENNFQHFAPELAKIIALKQEQAQHYGFHANAYDALLDDYEKGATVAYLDPVFNTIKEKLPPLLGKITGQTQIDDSLLRQYFNKDSQWEFSIEVLKTIGYDFDAGRQDYSVHPFTTSFSSKDVRITTRVDENDLASLLWSSIHEGGHALYEQGLPATQYGMPMGSYASLGIHESQSRLWENEVGRGAAFWAHFYPLLKKRFPEQLKNFTELDFYNAANKVSPSPIRTEADELTYHFHVLIRYEVEKALISGSLKVNDLKAYWNELYLKYLGISIQNDNEGILQDVHWSHGSFGYFPTYSLGSFYACQFYEKAKQVIPKLEQSIADGDISKLLQWLRKNIHHQGRRLRSDELCKEVTGQGLDIGIFIDKMEKKYAGIYGYGQ